MSGCGIACGRRVYERFGFHKTDFLLYAIRIVMVASFQSRVLQGRVPLTSVLRLVILRRFQSMLWFFCMFT